MDVNPVFIFVKISINNLQRLKIYLLKVEKSF